MVNKYTQQPVAASAPSVGESLPASPDGTRGSREVPPATGEPAREREERVRNLAYRKFEERAGAQGSPEQDWLAAEAELEALSAERSA